MRSRVGGRTRCATGSNRGSNRGFIHHRLVHLRLVPQVVMAEFFAFGSGQQPGNDDTDIDAGENPYGETPPKFH